MTCDVIVQADSGDELCKVGVTDLGALAQTLPRAEP